MVTEDRTQFPPDYSGQEVTDDKGTVFAWSYRDDLNPFTNPEQIGRMPPAERCQPSKEACVAAAWMDHDARVTAESLDRTTAFLVDCVGPVAAEEANQRAGQWASRLNNELQPEWESEEINGKVRALLMMRMLGNLLLEISDSIIKTVGGVPDDYAPGGDPP